MTAETPETEEDDGAPGGKAKHGAIGYVIGLGMAATLTWLSFVVAGGTAVWGPGIPAALLALAVAQIGVHLVFFLHISTGPDHTNNVLALAFGTLIIGLVLAGSLWIMAHLNASMMPGRMPDGGSF